MQPQQVKGFNYEPIAVTPYQDPWARYRAVMKIKEEEERRKQAVEKANGNRGKGKLGSNPLSAWISELSGAGGAIGGAAAGGAVGAGFGGVGAIPGAIIGGILGGFGGGTGGRAVENKVRDNEYRLGDALKEGAVSGAFGAIGPAWQGARGLSALGKASGNLGMKGGLNVLSGMPDDVAKVAGKSIARGGAKSGRAIGQGLLGTDEFAKATQKGAQSFGGTLRAYNRSTAVPGYKGLKPEEAARVNSVLDGVNKWFSGVGKTGQFRNLDDASKALIKQYARSPESKQSFRHADELLKKFNANIGKNPSIASNLEDTYRGANAAFKKSLERATKGFKTNDDFLKYVAEEINPRYRDIVSKTGAMGSKETQLYEAFRKAAKDIIDTKLPGKSGINKQLSRIYTADDLLQQAITRDVGAGAGQGTTVGRLVQNVIGPTSDIAGRTLQQTGKVSKFTTPALTGALTRGVANQAMGVGGQPLMEEEAPQDLSSALGTDPMGADLMGGDPMMGGFDSMAQPQYTLQQALQEAYSLLGDRQTPATYLQYAKAIMDANEGAGGQKLTANQSNKVTGLQGGLNQLNTLEQLYQKVGKTQNQATAGLGGVLGVKQFRTLTDPNVREYVGFAEGTIAPLIRSLGESGVLTDADREKALSAIPNLGDSEPVAKRKLENLKKLLETNIRSIYTGGYQDESSYTPNQLSQILSQGVY